MAASDEITTAGPVPLRGPHERSAGIFLTRPPAAAAKHAIERGEPPPTRQEPEPDRAATLFGSYATEVWWPAWSLTRPRSARSVKAKVNARIRPAFGDLPLNQVNVDEISRWTGTLAADGLSSASVRTYRALLGLILNAAVADGYLPQAPTLPTPRTDRPARAGQVWLTRVQLHRLADAIEPRYRALVLTATRRPSTSCAPTASSSMAALAHASSPTPPPSN